MHHTHTPGYSDFFTSGFRSFSKRLAMEDCNRRQPSHQPIPLSFDSVSSDSESEMESTKRRIRRTSVFSSAPFKSSPPGANMRSHSYTTRPRKQQHRCSSLISITNHLFGVRKPRMTTRRDIPSDESGWVSSTSSDCSFEEPVDFMDLSTWPECPNGGLEHHPRAVNVPQPESELLDPFSSSPDSKSFFVDVDISSPSSRGDIMSVRNTDSMSSGARSRRFSLSSISSTSGSSFFSSSSKRYSGHSSSVLSITSSSNTPPPDTSFLHLPLPKARKMTSVAKRPASIHVIPNSASSSPAIATSTAHIRSHSRSHTLPFSQAQTRSRVRSFFPSKSRPISAAIPENDNDDINNAPRFTTTIPDYMGSDGRTSVLNRASQGGECDDEVRPEIAGEEAPVSASDARYFFEMADDVPSRVDWREFCIEVLGGHSDA